jgi:hypothetical protein
MIASCWIEMIILTQLNPRNLKTWMVQMQDLTIPAATCGVINDHLEFWTILLGLVILP